MSADQARASASNVLPKIPGVKTVSIIRATTDSPRPLTPAPTSKRDCVIDDSPYLLPNTSARSNMMPDVIVEGNRYGAGAGTARNTIPQTIPMRVALHFRPVVSISDDMKMPLRKCSG